MAELFYKQGNFSRALCIYRQVVRNRPQDEQAKLRLLELEAHAPPHVDLHKALQHIATHSPSCQASCVMSFDGILVEIYQTDTNRTDIQPMLAEYTPVISNIQNIGPFDELVLSAQRFVLVIQWLSSDYFLAVVLGKPTLEGKARYLMRLAAPKLVEALL